jgi:hypothetical protein
VLPWLRFVAVREGCLDHDSALNEHGEADRLMLV